MQWIGNGTAPPGKEREYLKINPFVYGVSGKFFRAEYV